MMDDTELPAGIAEISSIFCGCGSPDLAWAVILKHLRRQNDLHEKKEESYYPFTTGEDYIVAYLLAHFDLTEHGGSVGGAWLTEKGKDALEFLEVFGCKWEKEL